MRKVVSLLLLSVIIACSSQRKILEYYDESKLSQSKLRDHAIFSENGKLIIQYRLDSNQFIVGRSGQPAIILYDYNFNDKLSKVTFLDKDSILCPSLAFTFYQYDKMGNLISEQSYNNKMQKSEYNYPITYNYSPEGKVMFKLREGKTNRSPFSDPGMIKYQYDQEGRITMEEYFNSEGEPASVNEMGIQSIKYQYNVKGQLIKETHFYSGTIDPEADPKYEWIHIYSYGSNNELIRCDVTWEFFGEKNSYSNFFKYDLKKHLYGVGRDSSQLEPTYPFERIENVIYQQIYSNDYFPYPKRVKFK